LPAATESSIHDIFSFAAGYRPVRSMISDVPESRTDVNARLSLGSDRHHLSLRNPHVVCRRSTT
jgi:hypothetical protein